MLNRKMNINGLGFLVSVGIAWVISPGPLPIPLSWSLGITALAALVGLGLAYWRDND